MQLLNRLFPGWHAADAAEPNDSTGTLALDGNPEHVVEPWSYDPDGDEADVVHDVLRRTDVWFAYKLSALEKEARELAESHAEKGQPRHDMERDGPLEMEVLLEQHAREVLSSWAERVKRKMQGAVGMETEKISAATEAAREAVANAAAAKGAMDRQRSLIAQKVAFTAPALEASRNVNSAVVEGESEVIECERHIATIWFLPLITLLVLADFFANVPVFVELFPADGHVDAAFARWQEGILDLGLPLWYGVAHLLKKIAVYPEPSILALSVVIFFLFLGHQLGGSVRALVVLWKHRRDTGLNGIGRNWRQAAWPAALSLLGVGLTLFVLFQARQQVHPMATDRLVSAQADLAVIQGEIASLQSSGSSVSPEVVQQLVQSQDDVADRRAKLDYAEAISGMNVPIALLNGVLIIAAILLGYLRENRSFTHRPQPIDDREDRHRRERVEVQAELSDMNAELDRLRATFLGRREAAHEAMRSVGGGLLRVQHLLEADLFRDWYGKSERLRRAIPLFRTENARLRSLDVEDILAFRQPGEMSLPTLEMLPTSLERPLAYAIIEQDFQGLKKRLDELDHESAVEAVSFLGIHPTARAESFIPTPSEN